MNSNTGAGTGVGQALAQFRRYVNAMTIAGLAVLLLTALAQA